MSNKEEKEVIYQNDMYVVEKILIKTGDEYTPRYGVYHIEYNILEVETNILAKALNSADELEVAVNTFYQGKSFEAEGSTISVIEAA